MRTITLEEHFAIPAFLEGPGRKLKPGYWKISAISGEIDFREPENNRPDDGVNAE